MADPLIWNDGQGFDIHVLRKGPPSPSLANSFDTPIFPLAQFPARFIPHFKGAPSAHGVTVNTTTGVVTAAAHPSAAQPMLRNFLMTARQSIPAQPPDPAQDFETKVRIHIHNSIQKIWLTPASLTVHTKADECQFSVLALFDDGSVGDITDWPQLAYTSGDTTAVNIIAGGGGKLTAEPGRDQTEMEVPITVRLKLTSPQTDVSDTAKVNTRMNWGSMGEQAVVDFVAGPVAPNPNDPSSSKPNSVKSVVQSRTNILFLSEGFPQAQEQDFKQTVEDLVKKGLPQEVLQPFKLLRGSINYWRCFVRSQEDGISLLGDYHVPRSGPMRSTVPRPDPPVSGATLWSVENMIHEIGLPVPADPVQSITDWVTHWKKLYTAPVTDALVAGGFSDWDNLRKRMPLNERDAVFGFARDNRARVSTPKEGDPLLRPALRRPLESRIAEFVGRLTFGVGIPGGDPFPLGETWVDLNKDMKLVGIVCLSDRDGGEARPSFFAATTGVERLAKVAVTTTGEDLQTSPLSTSSVFVPNIFASRVAHECTHAFGLGDEYGPGTGVARVAAPLVPNLQPRLTIEITPNPPAQPSQFDATKIKWRRLMRTIKIARTVQVDALGGNDFQMKLDPTVKHTFDVGDVVMLRQAPLLKNDPFVEHRFKVVQKFINAVDVTQVTVPVITAPSGQLTDLFILVCVNVRPGPELSLVAERVVSHISATGTPLNGPSGAINAPCVGSANTQPFMLPTNLPTSPALRFPKPPPTMADVVGLYEGGGHLDCTCIALPAAARCGRRTTRSCRSARCAATSSSIASTR